MTTRTGRFGQLPRRGRPRFIVSDCGTVVQLLPATRRLGRRAGKVCRDLGLPVHQWGDTLVVGQHDIDLVLAELHAEGVW